MKRFIKASVDWSYFNQFEQVIDNYLPDRGEGKTVANQIVTAVNKLIYKWYNDGDVFDTTHGMTGWANDLSDYANWLYKNVKISRPILCDIYECSTDDGYEQILKELADELLDAEILEKFENQPAVGSIYDCDGPFHFEEYSEDDEEDEYYEDDEEEEEEDEIY